MKYCKYCGMQLNDNEKCSCTEATAFEERKNKTIKLSSIIGAPIVALLVIVLIFVSQIKLNPFDYVKVTFEGVDGFGEAYVEIDENAMVERIIGEEPDEFEEYIEWSDKAQELINGIDYTVSQEEDLSNKDTITITFTFTGKIANKYKSGSQEFTIKGLKEVEKVDAFDEKCVAFKFTGLNGEGYFEYEILSEDDFYQDCTYSLKDDSVDGAISNGDVVEIVVNYDDWDAENNLKAPKEYSKTFTVSTMPKIMKPEDVPESVINEIKEHFDTNQKRMLENEGGYKFTDITYYGTYYYVPSEESDSMSETATKLVVYYSANRTDANKSKEHVYICIEHRKGRYDDIDGLAIYPDGSTNINVEDYYIYTSTGSIAEVIAEDSAGYFANDYIATKIY